MQPCSARVDFLAERSDEGALSDEERTEYEAFINAADFISIFKAQGEEPPGIRSRLTMDAAAVGPMAALRRE
jgi:hypothetical protein